MVTLNSDHFSKYCRDLAQLSDATIISTEPNAVFMKVDGAAGFGYIKLTNDNDTGKMEDQTLIEVSEPVVQAFALSYLNLFNKASTLTTFTRLYMTKEQPLIVEYKIDGLGTLKYYLAPKVDDQ